MASRPPDPRIRARYRQLRELLGGPPLKRPAFDITHDPVTGRIELVEPMEVGGEPRDVPLDLIGLGLAQIYSILAQALLGNTRAVGIEEPEAHLHAPTSGIELRTLLVRLVEEGYLDQLFIATHSNLFDLDPTGYFDVSHDPDNGTSIRRAELVERLVLHTQERQIPPENAPSTAQ